MKKDKIVFEAAQPRFIRDILQGSKVAERSLDIEETEDRDDEKPTIVDNENTQLSLYTQPPPVKKNGSLIANSSRFNKIKKPESTLKKAKMNKNLLSFEEI